MVRRWSATVDRRWLPLTATVDRWSGEGAGTVITSRGTTQVVTRGILMIGVRGTLQVYEVVSTRNDPEAHVSASHWWIQLAVTRMARNDENAPTYLEAINTTDAVA
ncbi:hypothetical protein Tco_1576206 [Tanacetum coccineum]